MLRHISLPRDLFAHATILVLLFQDATARPVTLGTSSASVAASMNGTSINPLVFVVPLVGAAVCVLLLASCCSCQRRKNRQLAKASNTPSRERRDDTYYGLGVVSSARANGEYAHLSDSVDEETLPPYTPTPPVPARLSNALASTWTRSYDGDEAETGKFLSAPSPAISRTGSPSLQTWSPRISPYLR